MRAIIVTLVVLVAVALASVVVRAEATVLALFGAMVIGEAMRPLVDRLSARMPRVAATAVSFLALFAVIALLWFLPIRTLIPQAVAFWHDLPAYATGFTARIAGFSAGAGATIGPLLERFLQLQAGIVSLFSTFALMLVMALFWLAASAALTSFLLSLVPQEQRTNVSALFSEIGNKLALYVTGALVNGAIVGLGSIVVLLLLRTPYPILLGLLQGLLIAIPYLGTLIGVLAVGGVVLAAQGWIPAVVAMLAVALICTIEGTFVSPLIFKQSLDVDPLLTIFAAAVGGTLFGVLGVALAVPAASIIQTIAVRVIAPAIRNRISA